MPRPQPATGNAPEPISCGAAHSHAQQVHTHTHTKIFLRQQRSTSQADPVFVWCPGHSFCSLTTWSSTSTTSSVQLSPWWLRGRRWCVWSRSSTCSSWTPNISRTTYTNPAWVTHTHTTYIYNFICSLCSSHTDTCHSGCDMDWTWGAVMTSTFISLSSVFPPLDCLCFCF